MGGGDLQYIFTTTLRLSYDIAKVTIDLRRTSNYPRESEGLCFYRRWFVCLSVCLFVTTITK